MKKPFRIKFGKNRIIVLTAIIFFLASLLFLAYSQGMVFQKPGSQKVFAKGKDHAVVLTNQGFSPAMLTINQGDTITFTTTAGKEFWPASDLHPTHDIYPEFDPRQPIESAGSWTFQFNKPGTWNFHNHLYPSMRGVVTVLPLSGNATDVVKVSEESCKDVENQKQCWSALMDQTLNIAGLGSAFDLLGRLYATEPNFATDCHDYTHKLGEKAYVLFSQNKEVPISAETTFCGYGFYHGFMEKLLLTSGNLDDASKFCVYVTETTTSSLSNACYHGVGHGAEALAVADSTTWGDPQKIANKALAVCSGVDDSDLNFSMCASGVFMELGNNFVGTQYGLETDIKNPFAICSGFDDRSKMSCYTQMYPVLKNISKENFAQAAAYVEKIADDRYAVEAMETLPGSFINIYQQDFSKEIETCRKIQSRLHDRCISGLALYFMLNGNPGSEYVQAENFCRTNKLTVYEKGVCERMILREGKGKYQPDTMQKVCNTVETAVIKEYCTR